MRLKHTGTDQQANDLWRPELQCGLERVTQVQEQKSQVTKR